MLEIRLDFLPAGSIDRHLLQELLQEKQGAWIATARLPEDGGRWSASHGSEDERRGLLRLASEVGFDYIDVEDRIAAEFPRHGSAKRIVSHHAMQSMPADVQNLHRHMETLDADVVKIAAMAEGPCDNFSLLSLIRSARIPTVAFCMGEFGTASRVLSAKFGSPFTYASIDDAGRVAPGLLTVSELKDRYFYESIRPDARVYAVIGDPIAQSKSPLVHNAALHAAEANGVYVPFRVPASCLGDFIKRMAIVPIDGLSVTIPHKQALLHHGKAGEPLVTKTQSANTWVRVPKTTENGEEIEPPPRLHNTDAAAALAALCGAVGVDPSAPKALAGKRGLVLGAGGVARTLAYSLKEAGAAVYITNRTVERAEELANEVGATCVPWEERATHEFDLLVNGTSLGMVPEIENTPFPATGLRSGMAVLDTVYNPEETRLLREAKSAGCRVASGVEMFYRQAEAQYRHFLGSEPPAGVMESVLRDYAQPSVGTKATVGPKASVEPKETT